MRRFGWGLAIGFGAGYVVGAKAGRERYEQIRSTWNQVKQNPTVQRAVEKGTTLAKEGAERGAHLASSATHRATERIRSTRGHEEEPLDLEPSPAAGDGHGA